MSIRHASEGRRIRAVRCNWLAATGSLSAATGSNVAALQFQCSECERCFNTVAQRNTHLYRVHNVWQLARLFIDESNVCFACLRMYGSQDQCVHHIRTRPSCLEVHCQNMSPMSVDRAQELDEIACAKEKGRILSRNPKQRMIQLHGPCLSSPGIASSTES